MRNIRTDLASELNENAGALAGVRMQNDEIDGFACTKVYVETEEGAAKLKKPMGKYFTLDVGDVAQKDSRQLAEAAKGIAAVMREIIGGGRVKDGPGRWTGEPQNYARLARAKGM